MNPPLSKEFFLNCGTGGNSMQTDPEAAGWSEWEDSGQTSTQYSTD